MLAISLLLTPPLVASCLAVLVRPYRRVVGWVSVTCAALSLTAGVWMSAEAVTGGLASGQNQLSDLWRVDALSALLALAVAFEIGRASCRERV